jgi:mRNA-degrading endonuclease RelE of RelBE toxin-antitoxin system
MTEPKRPLHTLDFTHAALRELEKLDPSVRRKVFSDIASSITSLRTRRS